MLKKANPPGVSKFSYAIMSHLSSQYSIHTKDLDTFALPVHFSTLPAFVQFPNYLPIKPPIYAICTWKNKKREGGGYVM